MTLHIAKDFLTLSQTATTYAPYYSLVATAMMLNGVFGFTVVGQTSFNLTSGSITKGQGTNNANINLGGTLTKAVQLPSGSYVVSVSDVDRILALRSNSNPRLNSGLFRISGFDSATNSVFVVPRAWSGDAPPAETNVSWKVYETESLAIAGFNTTANSLTGMAYRSWGTSPVPRIILQSPHSSAWQVRICIESNTDVNDATGSGAGGIGSKCSVVVGFAGDAFGDFAVGGRHFHMPLYHNLTSTHNHLFGGGTLTKTGGTVPGYPGRSTIEPMRYYGWSDDSTGSTVLVCRGHGDTSSEGIIVFGIPEDEELPLPVDPIMRLFCYGSSYIAAFNQLVINPGLQSVQAQPGLTWSFGNAPTFCMPGSWCFLAGNAAASSLMQDTTACDSPYIQKTELYGWDLYAGTFDQMHDFNEQGSIFPMEPRRLGRFPIIRRGRTNFNGWTLSNDQARSWIHLAEGIYAPWSGSIIP